MDTKNKTIAVILGATAAVVAGLLILAGIFLYLLDTRLKLHNDSEQTLELTALLQDHDNGNFYLSEQVTLEPNEQKRLSIGLQSVECIYVSGEDLDQSIVFTKNNYEKSENYPTKIFVDVSSLIGEVRECPLDQSRFSEGVSNAIKVPRNEWP